MRFTYCKGGSDSRLRVRNVKAAAELTPAAGRPILNTDGILYDARWIGDHGIGRFAAEILNALPFLAPFRGSRNPWNALDPLLLSAVLLRERPRLFFSPGYNSPLISTVPFVFTLHDLHHLRVPENSNGLKRAYYRYCIKPACHRAAFVLTVSEYSKAEIIDWAKVREEKVVKVGAGVGHPFTTAGNRYNPGYPYLLYVGSRKRHKNLPRLLEAYVISGVQNDVRLVLAGKPDESLCAEIHRLGLDDFVAFSGPSSNEDLAALYRGALAFLFPSLYEGFGLPPFEFMACGTPVLSSNVCALPEIIGDAGLLVDPREVEAIADGIRRLVGNSSLRTELKQRGLARVERFTWSETARKTQEILEIALPTKR